MVRRATSALFVVVLFFALWLGFAQDAAAWVEVHVGRDEIRVDVEASGKARIEHRIQLLVSGGPLRSYVLRGVRADAVVETGTFIVPEKSLDDLDAALPATVKLLEEPQAEGLSRTDAEISFDGVSRGRYVLVLRYRSDLHQAGALTSDGATMRLSFVAPSYDDGLDGASVLFTLPAAPTAPRGQAAEPTGDPHAEDSASDSPYFEQVDRRSDADLIRLRRLYVPRGERAVWAVAVDGRAFAGGLAAPTRTPNDSTVDVHGQRQLRSELAIGLALALALLISVLVVAANAEIRSRARERGFEPRPLLPMPLALRGLFAAGFVVFGVYLQTFVQKPVWGALAMLGYLAVIYQRTVPHKPAPRAPGKWLLLGRGEALHGHDARPLGSFHVGSRRGRVVFAGLAVSIAALGAALLTRDPQRGVWLCLDGAVVLSQFWVGGPRTLPPELSSAPIPLFTALCRRIERALPEARIAPRVRLPQGSADADEMRLLLLPKNPVLGLRGIEIAATSAAGPGGYVLLPVVLVRFERGSPAEQVLERHAPSAKREAGRRLSEGVFSFTPKLPTARVVSDICLALLERTEAKQQDNLLDESVPPPLTKKRQPPVRVSAARPAGAKLSKAS